MAILQPGTQAPDFSLAAHAGDPQKLASFRSQQKKWLPYGTRTSSKVVRCSSVLGSPMSA